MKNDEYFLNTANENITDKKVDARIWNRILEMFSGGVLYQEKMFYQEWTG